MVEIALLILWVILIILVISLVLAFTPDPDAKIEAMTKSYQLDNPSKLPNPDPGRDVTIFCLRLMAVSLAPVSLAILALPGAYPMDLVIYLLLAFILGILIGMRWANMGLPKSGDPDKGSYGRSHAEGGAYPGGREHDAYIDKLDRS